jgi:hypothetical protein
MQAKVTDFEAVVEKTGALILDTRKTGAFFCQRL